MEWEIKRGSNGCLLCNKGFFEEEEYYSALFDENKMFVRKDFCSLCWNKGENDGVFSFWKTKVPKKDKPIQTTINLESLLDMFMKLEGNNETHQKNLRYVLALYLIRKKVFKLKSLKRQEGGEVIVLSYPREDKEFDVLNPCLKEEQIESITVEMWQLLNYPYLDCEVLSIAN
ncbi:hypothetical protein BIY37_05915 [Candidatus Brocadia sapporoensis]|uniref:Uncharacterized protein n=1 Tax=Candidatus Brocadia sapporoensis TaxID=392547 RepID=A0A1V6M0J6_9BACT|nr:hypothetical protein [Candidatus Brocadia sapporoensis]OQD45919.1 hypothetical protein BIY37_05915 [Candidatus Brocadia sapporoensis]GJQ24270.1 MAG: hypothetical protein HBSAPP01_20600 [Candidatus Brocadia sapporoensis]